MSNRLGYVSEIFFNAVFGGHCSFARESVGRVFKEGKRANEAVPRKGNAVPRKGNAFSGCYSLPSKCPALKSRYLGDPGTVFSFENGMGKP